MLKGRLILEWSVIAFFVSLITGLASYADLTRRFDNLLYDFAAVRRAAPASDKILIVEMDNQSLARIGKSPWPRTVHAALLRELAKSRPALIAYDILFVENAGVEEDEALAAAMREGAPVILPVLYETPGRNGAGSDIYPPVSPLREAAKGVGTVNLVFDEDGLVRRAQLQTRTDNSSLPHLMELAYRLISGAPSKAYRSTAAEPAGPQPDDRGTMLIAFLKEGAFRRVSFHQMLAGEIPSAFVKNKIILVGATAPGLGDRYPVPGPVGSTMSGVEIQANMLNSLLNDRFIHRAPRWLSVAGTLLPLWILLAAFLLMRPGRNLILSLTLIVGVLLLSLLGVAVAGYWLPPSPALLGLLIVYPLWGWRRLAALSSFVAQETRMLKAEPGLSRQWVAPSSGLDSVATEASELKNIIGTMRTVQRFMSDVVTGFPDAVVVVDQENRITLANDEAEAVLGADISGKMLHDLLAGLKQDAETPADELTLANGRTFLLRRAPLTLDNSWRAGAIVRLADITKLKAADRDREQVLEFLSHDMRTPQAAILSRVEMNEKKASDPGVFNRIAEYARQTLNLADDFVQRARLGSVKKFDQDVNIANAMAEAIDRCWPQANQKQIKIIAAGLDLEAFISGDASSLMRAFTNLIDNAIKYSPQGSQVTCSVDMDTSQSVPQGVCTISDQGPGMPEERMADIFAAYGARGSQTTSGTGLGLAFVKTVVDRHEGKIICKSSPDSGTSFQMSFPLAS